MVFTNMVFTYGQQTGVGPTMGNEEFLMTLSRFSVIHNFYDMGHQEFLMTLSRFAMIYI